MTIASRTPEGRPNHCPVCGTDLKIEPSDPPGDALCPRCGHLLWFTWEDLGDVQIIRPTGNLFYPESFELLLESVTLRRGLCLVLDFSDVQFLSSRVLGEMINLKKKVHFAHAKLRIQNLHPDLLEVFRITRLDQLFDIEP